MAAIFQWCEANGSGATVTDGITNLNMGDVDAPNLVTSTYPIVAGENSYEKFIKAKFTSTFTEISNMKFWKSAGALKTGETVKANLVLPASYSQPVKTTSSQATTDVPESLGAALAVRSAADTATITATGYTEYICMQLRTTGSTPAGAVNTKTYTFQYDEV